MKLYNVPRNTKIKVLGNIRIPPDAPQIETNEVLQFYHIDGMYSLCKNSKDEWVHLVAWADVEIVTNGD